MSLRSRIVDGVFSVLELLAAGYDFIRNLRRPRNVHIRNPEYARDTDPIPLVYKTRESVNEPLTERLPKPPRVPRDLR